MAYIGKSPTIGNFQKCDAITVVNGQAAYTMQVGGTNVSPESENHMLVSLNGILQAPVDSFTISGSTITFASNLATGDVIDFIMLLGNVLDLGTPSDNTVSLAKLTATGTKDATTFLRGDNTFATIGGGITLAQQWRITADFSSTSTDPIGSNWEQVDTDGYGSLGTDMTESSGTFSFPETGIYYITLEVDAKRNGSTRYWKGMIKTTTDNSTYAIASEKHAHIKQEASETHDTLTTSFIFDVTSTTTHKVRFSVASDQSVTYLGNTSELNTGVTFIRLGDT